MVMNADTDTYTDRDTNTGKLLEMLKWRNAGLFGKQSVKFGLSTYVHDVSSALWLGGIRSFL